MRAAVSSPGNRNCTVRIEVPSMPLMGIVVLLAVFWGGGGAYRHAHEGLLRLYYFSFRHVGDGVTNDTSR